MKSLSATVLIALCAASASCARTASDVHLMTPLRPPVGARLVPQPWQSGEAALKMDLSAYLVNEPAMVDVRMRVEPDQRSRSLTVEWWTPDGTGGSHLISLEGERAPVRFTYPIKRMTEGQYTVTAVLRRNDGTEVQARRRMFVTSKEAILNAVPGIAESASGTPIGPGGFFGW